MGQTADIFKGLKHSKLGERQVILGFLFHWEQSEAWWKKAGWLVGIQILTWGHPGKTQGKSDVIQEVLELVPSAGTWVESALKELWW